MNNQSKLTCENSVVLYGISKVEYGANGCTPYPMCVKSCANYLGQDIGIDFAMVSTGAAFRLTWDTTSWNGGNVDVIHTYDDPEEVYRLGIEALGREFQILSRTTNPWDVKLNNSTKSDTKDDFISFIKAQIDRGFPCSSRSGRTPKILLIKILISAYQALILFLSCCTLSMRR